MIHWTAFLDVSSPEKAHKVLGKIGFNLIDGKVVEVYWKNTALLKVTFKQEFEGQFSDFCKTLLPIANRWTLTLPDEDRSCNGSATLDDIRIQGIYSIHFEMEGLKKS